MEKGKKKQSSRKNLTADKATLCHWHPQRWHNMVMNGATMVAEMEMMHGPSMEVPFTQVV